MNEKTFRQKITTRESIVILEQLMTIDCETAKTRNHAQAISEGANALEEQEGEGAMIRLLRYHACNEGAALFPDAYTKAALQAAKNALRRRLAREMEEARQC